MRPSRTRRSPIRSVAAGAVVAIPKRSYPVDFRDQISRGETDGKATGNRGLGQGVRVRYGLILARVAGPMPQMFTKLSMAENAPFVSRLFRIRAAMLGPIPGTRCNSSRDAWFTSTAA